MTTDSSQQHSLETRYRAKIRLGLYSALALAALTLVEYVIAVAVDEPTLWLVPFMLAKGFVILEFFMHYSDLTHPEDH